MTEAASELSTGVTGTSTARRPAWMLPFLVAVVGVTAVALTTALALSGRDHGQSLASVPAENGPDVGFARDMQVHHAQAVEMSFAVLEGVDDPLVRSMARDIAATQQHQIGQMYAWLELWNLSQTGTQPGMAWMPDSNMSAGHQMPSGDAAMPGMATAAQVERLRQASGGMAERMWLRLMIRHHRGGITMAKAALERATQPEVRQLAEATMASQQTEVDQMRQMLEARRDATS